jgi:hypothetical protein
LGWWWVVLSPWSFVNAAPPYALHHLHKEPSYSHDAHVTSLCWTIQLKQPLHFNLSQASADNFLENIRDNSDLDSHLRTSSSNQESTRNSQNSKSSISSEISKEQKVFVYHRVALELAQELRLKVIRNVGELLDHFVLCYDDDEDDVNNPAQSKSRTTNYGYASQSLLRSGKYGEWNGEGQSASSSVQQMDQRPFRHFHKKHSDLRNADAAAFDQVM